MTLQPPIPAPLLLGTTVPHCMLSNVWKSLVHSLSPVIVVYSRREISDSVNLSREETEDSRSWVLSSQFDKERLVI